MHNDKNTPALSHLWRFVIGLMLVCLWPNITVADDIIPAEDFDVFMDAVERSRIIENEKRSEALANDIVSFATSMLGHPYRRGGKGPNAFDCSGFTAYIFRRFDTHLAASSRSQYLQGESISKDEIRPGDLLFFTGRTSGKNVSHVGIATEISPDGRISFIHAAHKGGIRIDFYPDGGYYSKHYVGARRVI